MSYRVIAAASLALLFLFAGVGLSYGQSSKAKTDDKTAKEAETKDSKEEGKKEEGKEDPKPEEKFLTKKEAHEAMEAMEKAWNKLKMNLKNKRGDVVSEQADLIAELAAKFRKYDGLVLTGDEKGKKARDQKDFKDWLDELEKASKELSKNASKSKWDKIDKDKETMGDTCGACHDVYQPVEEE